MEKNYYCNKCGEAGVFRMVCGEIDTEDAAKKNPEKKKAKSEDKQKRSCHRMFLHLPDYSPYCPHSA